MAPRVPTTQRAACPNHPDLRTPHRACRSSPLACHSSLVCARATSGAATSGGGGESRSRRVPVERRRIALPGPHQDRCKHPPLSSLAHPSIVRGPGPPRANLAPPLLNCPRHFCACPAPKPKAKLPRKHTTPTQQRRRHSSRTSRHRLDSPRLGRTLSDTGTSLNLHLLYVYTIAVSRHCPPRTISTSRLAPRAPSPGTYTYSTVCSGIRRSRSPGSLALASTWVVGPPARLGLVLAPPPIASPAPVHLPHSPAFVYVYPIHCRCSSALPYVSARLVSTSSRPLSRASPHARCTTTPIPAPKFAFLGPAMDECREIPGCSRFVAGHTPLRMRARAALVRAHAHGGNINHWDGRARPRSVDAFPCAAARPKR